MDKPRPSALRFALHFLAMLVGVGLGFAAGVALLALSMGEASPIVVCGALVAFGCLLGYASWATALGAVLLMTGPGPSTPCTIAVATGGAIGVVLARVLHGNWRSIYESARFSASTARP
jgi:RsiW-degrading membrane proteinase PrsW (M82 family)